MKRNAIICVIALSVLNTLSAFAQEKQISKLLELAQQNVPSINDADGKPLGQLTKAEEELLEGIDDGNGWNHWGGAKNYNNPENAAYWGPERVLRAKIIEWICKDEEAHKLISFRGIEIRGARIEGKLDISSTDFSKTLVLEHCSIADGLECMDVHFKSMNLSDSHIKHIAADRVKVDESVIMEKVFTSKGTVSFNDATIVGDLDCAGGKFINEEGLAFSANGVKVDGNISLSNAMEIKGAVQLKNTSIGGGLSCVGAFENVNDYAIDVEESKIAKDVYLSSLSTKGEVNLLAAEIGGNLDCQGGKFENANGKALTANYVKVLGSILMRGFTATGSVQLSEAVIGGDVDCEHGNFENVEGLALTADKVNIGGRLQLRDGFSAKGKVTFREAIIGGDFECRNGYFKNELGTCLDADKAKIAGGVFLGMGLTTIGEVRFCNAEIGGDFDCRGGIFKTKSGKPINVDGANVKGKIYLQN